MIELRTSTRAVRLALRGSVKERYPFNYKNVWRRSGNYQHAVRRMTRDMTNQIGSDHPGRHITTMDVLDTGISSSGSGTVRFAICGRGYRRDWIDWSYRAVFGLDAHLYPLTPSYRKGEEAA